MSDASELNFKVDGSSHSIEGDIIPAIPPDSSKDEEVRKPISRVAAAKSLGSAIGGIHWVAAKVLDEPGLDLSKEEKRIYGESAVDLLKAYNYDLTTNPKLAAWINLSVVALEIDGPRVVLLVTKPPEKKYTDAEDGEVPPLIFPERKG